MTPKGWRVTGHTESVTLLEARFKVSEAGRQRVLREKKKNVHAIVEGYAVENFSGSIGGRRAFYNPYKAGTFTDKDGLPITSAKVVQIKGSREGYSIRFCMVA